MSVKSQYVTAKQVKAVNNVHFQVKQVDALLTLLAIDVNQTTHVNNYLLIESVKSLIQSRNHLEAFCKLNNITLVVSEG